MSACCRVQVELPPSLAAGGFSLRPEAEADDPFLLDLYESARASELAMLAGWTSEQRRAFISQQFHAQRHHYRERLVNCRFDVIERENEPVGRLYTQETPSQLRIIDIALIPVLRGQGFGTSILRHLLAGADAAGLPVGLFVEPGNPASRLYRRLGFLTVAELDFYTEMERPCESRTVRETEPAPL